MWGVWGNTRGSGHSVRDGPHSDSISRRREMGGRRAARTTAHHKCLRALFAGYQDFIGARGGAGFSAPRGAISARREGLGRGTRPIVGLRLPRPLASSCTADGGIRAAAPGPSATGGMADTPLPHQWTMGEELIVSLSVRQECLTIHPPFLYLKQTPAE